MFWKTDTLPCKGNPCKCIDNKLVDREIKLNKLFGVDNKKSPYFKNNHNLRSSNILFEYTKEEITDHIKAKKDIIYFHYLSQRDKKNQLTLYKFQEDLLKSSQKNRFNLVVNSQQSGMSYMLAIKALYSAFSKCDINVLILTDGQRILELLKDVYQTLPFFMKPGIKVWNKKDIQFDNGSRIMCNVPSKLCFGRGYQHVIVDNYSYMSMKDKTTIYQGLVPTLLAMSNSELFISSVPNGDDHFKSLVDDEGGMFTKYKLHWSDVPTRDNNWKSDRIKVIGSVESFAQEYENLFTGTKEWNRYINLNKLLD